jgi:hypothetical protein
MPVHECTENGRPGYSYGGGKCYTYTDEASRKKAKQQAYLQGAAIEASQERRGEKPKVAPVEFEETKAAPEDVTAPETVPPDLLKQIERYAGEPVPADQVLVRYARLANDQLDRSHERFPLEYLHRFKETMAGKSLLPGHDRSQVPLGIWLEGEVEKDEAGVSHLRVPFYMDARSEMARRVRLGIAKKVSISFKAPERTCDLCGQTYDGQNGCENGHRKGQSYDGKLCTVTYSGDPRRVEAMEGSLVWLNCQYGAEVTGAKTPEEGEVPDEMIELRAKVAELEDENKSLSGLAEDGKAYREFLKSEIARKLTAPLVDKPEEAKAEAETILKTLENANLETLRAWDKMAQTKFDAAFPPQPQSKPLGSEPGSAVPAPPASGQIQPGKFDPHGSLRRAS